MKLQSCSGPKANWVYFVTRQYIKSKTFLSHIGLHNKWVIYSMVVTAVQVVCARMAGEEAHLSKDSELK